MIGYNATNLISLTAAEPIAPGLRVKWHSTAGQVVIAGDEACIGISANRAHAAGKPITILDIKTVGTVPFTAGGAIAEGDRITSAAAGKVVTGTDGNQDYGYAFSKTTGDGQEVECSTGL